jgi:hypothetical protein
VEEIEFESKFAELELLVKRNIVIYRSSGKERMAIAAWSITENIDILGRMEIFDSAIAGWVSRIRKHSQRSSLESEIYQMVKINPFLDDDFTNWFLEYRQDYPKTTLQIIILEFMRQELIDFLNK